jgi:hypothetical protein
VIDFDESKRRRFVERLGQRFEAIFEDGEALATAGGERASRSRAWVALLLLVPFAAWLTMRARKQRAVDPQALGGRVRRALGARNSENLTLGALLSRVDPLIVEEAELCVRRYEEWRFGGAENVVELLAAVVALERARRQRVKRRR